MPDASFPVTCAWSLYPLGEPDYMDVIYREIDKTLASAQVKAAPSHYCSGMDGAVADVFATLKAAFNAVRHHIHHTVIHATISKGSRSRPGEQINVYGGGE